MDSTELYACKKRLLSIADCCRQASGNMDLPTVDSNGKYSLDGIRVEGEDGKGAIEEQEMKRRPGENHKPKGAWPAHWGDFTHEPEGHNLDSNHGDANGEELLQRELMTIYAENGIQMASDDVSGASLDPALVHMARATEIEYFKGMGVYERVHRSEQQQTKGKIIGTKWIDTNKGDSANPKIRSRLVGKEFRTGPDDALFASTPPLEALRLIVSRAATAVE